jgi:hypothetical protein
VLGKGNAVYTPGVSEVRSSVTTFSHAGLKNAGAQTDALAFGGPSEGCIILPRPLRERLWGSSDRELLVVRDKAEVSRIKRRYW